MQHDVLRDLALHLSNSGNINHRKRLFMPRREASLPKEWERNSDQPFNAQIVSLHTGISYCACCSVHCTGGKFHHPNLCT